MCHKIFQIILFRLVNQKPFLIKKTLELLSKFQ
jgi:hypothetical protein